MSRSTCEGRPTLDLPVDPVLTARVRALSDQSTSVPMMCPPAEQFGAAMDSAGIGDGSRVVLYDAQMNAWAARVEGAGCSRRSLLDCTVKYGVGDGDVKREVGMWPASQSARRCRSTGAPS